MLVPMSIVIPYKNNGDNRQIYFLLEALLNQTYLPKEINIVHSNRRKNIIHLDFIKKFKKKIKINIIYKNNVYPGEARNFGILKSKYEIIAFLDQNTIPDKNWLKEGYLKIIKRKDTIIIGNTQYKGKTYKDRLIISATTGFKTLNTLPGSIIKKETIKQNGLFLKRVRSGEDGEWLKRLKLNNLKFEKSISKLTYEIKYYKFKNVIDKWFLYYSSSAHLEHLKIFKQIYLMCFLMIILLFIYNWNAVIANWDQNSVQYVHHITKKFILFLALTYTLIRGVLIPLKKGVKIGFLIKGNLILITIFCSILDSIKTYCFLKKFLKKV